MLSINVTTFHTDGNASASPSPLVSDRELDRAAAAKLWPQLQLQPFQDVSPSPSPEPMSSPSPAPPYQLITKTKSLPLQWPTAATTTSDRSTDSPSESPFPSATPSGSPTPSEEITSSSSGRTLYHIVLRSANGFEKTVYRRWSHVVAFDKQWSELYPSLHKQFHIEIPKFLMFHSRSKRQAIRLNAIQTYIRRLLPVVCLRAFLAEFLDVSPAVLEGKDVSPQDSPSVDLRGVFSPQGENHIRGLGTPMLDLRTLGSPLPELRAMGVFPSGVVGEPSPSPDPIEPRVKGNTLEADRKAQKALKKFHHENRKAFEKLMPDLMQAALRDSASPYASPSPPPPAPGRSLLPFPLNAALMMPFHPLTYEASRVAQTAPSSSQVSRRESMSQNNGISSVSTNSMMPFADDGDAPFVDQESSVDFSKLQTPMYGNSVGTTPLTSETPVPVASSDRSGTPSLATRGLPSRSTHNQQNHPLFLSLKSGGVLKNFTLNQAGWWFARDAQGNECYYRSASMGGHASLVRANSRGFELQAPPSEAMLAPPMQNQPAQSPPLPRRGSIYQRAKQKHSNTGTSFSMPVSGASSRNASPGRTNRGGNNNHGGGGENMIQNIVTEENLQDLLSPPEQWRSVPGGSNGDYDHRRHSRHNSDSYSSLVIPVEEDDEEWREQKYEMVNNNEEEMESEDELMDAIPIVSHHGSHHGSRSASQRASRIASPMPHHPHAHSHVHRRSGSSSNPPSISASMEAIQRSLIGLKQLSEAGAPRLSRQRRHHLRSASTAVDSSAFRARPQNPGVPIAGEMKARPKALNLLGLTAEDGPSHSKERKHIKHHREHHHRPPHHKNVQMRARRFSMPTVSLQDPYHAAVDNDNKKGD